MFVETTQVSIDTIPSSLGPVIATRYSPFVATATIIVQHRLHFCQWQFGRNYENDSFFSHGLFSECLTEDGYQAATTCAQEGDSVTTNLTFPQPRNNGILNVRVYCEYFGTDNYTETLPTFTIQGKKKVKLNKNNKNN